MTLDQAAMKLRRYADAWSAPIGCSCNSCAQCEARNLSCEEAERIADLLDPPVPDVHFVQGPGDDHTS